MDTNDFHPYVKERLDDQLIEDIHIVNLSRPDDQHRRNVPVKIQESMKFDCALAFSELGPGEKRQAQVDSGRIQDTSRLIEIDAEGICGVNFPGFCDEDVSEIGINPPIPVLIGVGQGVAGDLPSDTQMIKSGLGCP